MPDATEVPTDGLGGLDQVGTDSAAPTYSLSKGYSLFKLQPGGFPLTRTHSAKRRHRIVPSPHLGITVWPSGRKSGGMHTTISRKILSHFPDSVYRRGAVPQMEEIVQSPSRSDIPPLNPYAQVGRSYFTRGSATYPPALN